MKTAITNVEKQAFFKVCKDNGVSISEKPNNKKTATILCGDQYITFSRDLKVEKVSTKRTVNKGA